MKIKSTAYKLVCTFAMLALFLILPMNVLAEDTQLTTLVPSSHTLYIELIGNGRVVIDGVAYAQTADVQVQRQHRPEISIQAADGSKIKTAFWGSENVTANFPKGEWTAPEVTEDIVLSVTFEKISSTPQTGDLFNLNLWISLLIISAFGMMICLLSIKKKVQ